MEKIIGDYKITVDYDDFAENPREWDNLGKMVCFHKRYSLGDKTNFKSNDYNSFDELKKDIIRREKISVILPLYMYDHSGITISTSPFSCPWDSGQIGFTYITKEDAKKEFGCKIITPKIKEKLIKILNNEIETYDQFVRGEIYSYIIEKISKCDLDHEHLEIVYSCGGFFDEDECLKEAEGFVEYEINKN
jgi:hypothetical protein